MKVYFSLFLFQLLSLCPFFLFVNAQPKIQHVSFEQFGAKGDGNDDTNAILLALNFAKKNKLPIRLQGKNYKFSPNVTVDITGIPLFSGIGTFDLTNTGIALGNISQKAIFHVQGSKLLIKKNITSCKKGVNRLQIGKDFLIKRNDILFITSSESLPNNKREYYCKGQRCIVKAYDNHSGIVEFFDEIHFDFQDAYLWLHNYIPEIQVDSGIQFITSPMNFLSCFRLYYAKAKISGYFKNFSLSAVMFKSSFGIVENMEADLPVTSNNGYSYCVEVSDLSDVFIKNCRLSGGRHVITSGGGGLWKKEESGGNGGAAGYPSTVLIDGGIYKGTKNIKDINENIGTIDSHGLAYKMVIKNATIFGGVNLGANFVIIDNCLIYTDSKRILNVGSDVISSTDWGHYEIKNSVFIVDQNSRISSLIFCKADVNYLKLNNITIKFLNEENILADFLNFTPKFSEFNRISFKNCKPSKTLIVKRKMGNIKIYDSDLRMENAKIY